MKKLLILACVFLICSCKKEKEETSTNSDSQSNQSCSYTFSKSSETYVPLSSADGYYDEYGLTGTPIGSIPFTFRAFGKIIDNPFEADVNDLHLTSGTDKIYLTYYMPSIDPPYISWKTTGISGSQIMKIQLEDFRTSTSDLNMQIWLYEQSNIIEIHYGKTAQRTSDLELPFLIRHENSSDNLLNGVALSGDANSPSLNCLGSNSIPDVYNLTGTITDGLVYRFTPKN